MKTHLKLFVTGDTVRADRAIASLRTICDEYIAGDFEIEVIDVKRDPQLAEDAKIIATPTLVRVLPEPARRIIGDLSDADRVALGLDFSREAADGR